MSNLTQALRMAYQCSPRRFALRMLFMLMQSVLPLVNLYVLKLLIEKLEYGLQAPHVGIVPFATLLMVYVAVFLANRLIGTLSTINNDILSQRFTDYMADKMQQQAARLDLAYFDTPEYHDTYHRAQTEATTRPLQVMNAFIGIVGSAVSIAGVVALLSSSHSWLVMGVMLLAVLPTFAVRLYKAHSIYQFRRNSTQLYRQTGYYNALLTAREPAKEVRAFRLIQHFRTRFINSRIQLVQRLIAISRRLGWMDALCAVVEAAALLAVLLLLGSDTLSGALTIGTFVMLFEAFRRGQGYMQGLVGGLASLYDNRLFVNNLFEFLNLEPHVLSPIQPISMPQTIEKVEFCDVTFRYPDMKRNVLQHFSLVAHRGEVCCIEGRNGYGKSTLLKLLMRFYDPDEGLILINGIDIRHFAIDHLRQSVAALFQDFMRYNCTLAENIAFGSIEGIDHIDPDRMHQAATMAGVDSIAQRLPQGYDTMLGRMFEGGAELSMGQWQRVALARLYYANTPIMLLDEPMAWMDMDTRDQFRQQIEELSKSHIIILISHV